MKKHESLSGSKIVSTACQTIDMMFWMNLKKNMLNESSQTRRINYDPIYMKFKDEQS